MSEQQAAEQIAAQLRSLNDGGYVCGIAAALIKSQAKRIAELEAVAVALLPVIEQYTPPLSTAGTMVSLRNRVRDAIAGRLPEPPSDSLEAARSLLKRCEESLTETWNYTGGADNALEDPYVGDRADTLMDDIRETLVGAVETPAPLPGCRHGAEDICANCQS